MNELLEWSSWGRIPIFTTQYDHQCFVQYIFAVAFCFVHAHKTNQSVVSHLKKRTWINESCDMWVGKLCQLTWFSGLKGQALNVCALFWGSRSHWWSDITAGSKPSGSHQLSHYVGLHKVTESEHFAVLFFSPSIIWVCLWFFLMLFCRLWLLFIALLHLKDVRALGGKLL